jgi:hypothetical protein
MAADLVHPSGAKLNLKDGIFVSCGEFSAFNNFVPCFAISYDTADIQFLRDTAFFFFGAA